MFPGLEEIKKRRLRLGLNQRELAVAVGTSQSLIAKTEAGTVKPSYEVVKKIFEHLESLEKKNVVGRAKDARTPNVVWVKKDDAVGEAASLMFRYGFSQLPVRDEQERCVGSLPDKSIVGKLLALEKPEDLYSKRVEEVMEEQFPIVDEETPLTVVATLLQHSQAVLTAKGGKITGIITNSNVISFMTKSG